MKVFNTDMELVTFIFLISEIILLLFQLLFYYQASYDKKKGNYLTLLFLFVVYNLFGGLFPDPNQPLSIVIQNILAYGSGFALACYFPFFFYKNYNFKRLKFHVFYGVSVFFVLPFIAFIVVEYLFTGVLNQSVKHAMFVPAVYAIVVIYVIFREIKRTFDRENRETTEIVLTYISIIPWVSMPVLSYFAVGQLIEASVMNGGFVITSCLFFWRNVQESKLRNEQLNELLNTARNDLSISENEQFLTRCGSYNLTTREIQVAELMTEGLKYKEIASTLFIADRTVTKHAQNIYLKVGVTNKFDLIKALKTR